MHDKFDFAISGVSGRNDQQSPRTGTVHTGPFQAALPVCRCHNSVQGIPNSKHELRLPDGRRNDVAIVEAKSAIFPIQAVSLIQRIKLGEQAAYETLVALVAEACHVRSEGRRYFPISILREACRQYLKQTTLDLPDKLLSYQVFSDAVLSAMAASSAGEISRLGYLLRDMLQQFNESDPGKALLLRLHHIVGLQWNEICAFPIDKELLRAAETSAASLRADLEVHGVSPEVMLQQNLKPRGQVTQLLEDVRDGERPLGDVVVHEHLKLRRQAEHLLRLEGQNISLQADDLVNEMFLRMPRDPNKSPVNHMEFEALARRIMRHVLVDRARKPIPGQGRFREELREDISTSSAFVEDRLLWGKVVQVVDEVIKELRRSDPESAEMLHATLYRDVDQRYLAKLHDVSISTVKRRIKEGRNRIRKRLGLELKR